MDQNVRGKMLPQIVFFMFCLSTLSHVECMYKPTGQAPTVTPVGEICDSSDAPFWDSEKQALYFVDSSGFKVNRYDPVTKVHTTAYIGTYVSFIVPIKGTKDEFLIGRGADLVNLKWDGFNTVAPTMKILTTVDTTKIGNSFSDGTVDQSGRLWAGTQGYDNPKTGINPKEGTLFRMVATADTNVCKMEAKVMNVTISSGIVWSIQDNIMYYIDKPIRRIDSFEFDIINGVINLNSRKTVFDFERNAQQGQPDGMAVDEDGKLWVACNGAKKVIRIDPDTCKVMTTINIPVEKITSLAFGGLNYDTLFVTTVQKGLTGPQKASQAKAGSLFAITNLPAKGFYNSPVDSCDSWAFY